MTLQTINVGTHIEPDTRFMHFKVVAKVSWMPYVIKNSPKLNRSSLSSYHIFIF